MACDEVRMWSGDDNVLIRDRERLVRWRFWFQQVMNGTRIACHVYCVLVPFEYNLYSWGWPMHMYKLTIQRQMITSQYRHMHSFSDQRPHWSNRLVDLTSPRHHRILVTVHKWHVIKRFLGFWILKKWPETACYATGYTVSSSYVTNGM